MTKYDNGIEFDENSKRDMNDLLDTLQGLPDLPDDEFDKFDDLVGSYRTLSEYLAYIAPDDRTYYGIVDDDKVLQEGYVGLTPENIVEAHCNANLDNLVEYTKIELFDAILDARLHSKGTRYPFVNFVPSDLYRYLSYDDETYLTI